MRILGCHAAAPSSAAAAACRLQRYVSSCPHQIVCMRCSYICARNAQALAFPLRYSGVKWFLSALRFQCPNQTHFENTIPKSFAVLAAILRRQEAFFFTVRLDEPTCDQDIFSPKNWLITQTEMTCATERFGQILCWPAILV